MACLRKHVSQREEQLLCITIQCQKIVYVAFEDVVVKTKFRAVRIMLLCGIVLLALDLFVFVDSPKQHCAAPQ